MKTYRFSHKLEARKLLCFSKINIKQSFLFRKNQQECFFPYFAPNNSRVFHRKESSLIFALYRPEIFSFYAFCHFSHHRLRNSEKRRTLFFPLRVVVVMTIPRPKKGKKIRQYRIKVLSTPRWSSLYSQLVPSATLAK